MNCVIRKETSLCLIFGDLIILLLLDGQEESLLKSLASVELLREFRLILFFADYENAAIFCSNTAHELSQFGGGWKAAMFDAHLTGSHVDTLCSEL